MWPMQPIRHTRPASGPDARADLDPVTVQQRGTHLGLAHAAQVVGNPHRGELGKAMTGGSDELEPQLLEAHL